MTILRQALTDFMAAHHQIRPELAGYHVGRMSDAEVWEKWQGYKRLGMELSVASPKSRAGYPVSTQVPGPATMTAG